MARDLDIKSNIVDTDQYVYRQERDMEKTQVDWSQIAKDVTGTVEKIRDDRQAEKNELAKTQRDTMNILADYDQYDAEALNKVIIGGAHNASNYLVMLNNQMRNGEISPTDYMMGAQGITDNFGQLKSATKNWDTHYKEAMSRLELNDQGDPAAHFGEEAMNMHLSVFGNLSTMDLYINPLTSSMSFVKKGADVNDPANHESINSINVRMQQKGDFININTLQDKQVLGLAKIAEVNTGFSRDATMTLEDFRQLKYTGPDGVKKNYQDLMDGYISANLATSAMKMSTLQQFAGYNPTNTTYDEEEFKKDPMKVLMRPDRSGNGRIEYIFSDELEAKMRELQMTQFETKLDKIYKFDKGYPLAQKDPNAKTDKETYGQTWGYIDKIKDAFSGNQTTKDEAVTYLRGEMPPHPEFGKFKDIDSESSEDYWYIIMDNKRIPVPKYQVDANGNRKLDDNNQPIKSDFKGAIEQAVPYILGGRTKGSPPIDQAMDTYVTNYGADAFSYQGPWASKLSGTGSFEMEGKVDANSYYQDNTGNVVQAPQLFKDASNEDSENKRGDAYVGATNSYVTKNLPNNKVSVKWDDNLRPLDDINTIILTVDNTEYPKKFNLKKGSNEYYQWLQEKVNEIRAANDAKTKQGMSGDSEGELD